MARLKVQRALVERELSAVLGQRGIGISSMIQPEDLEDTSGETSLVLMIHDAPLGDMKSALAAIRQLGCVLGEPSWMRVETLQG